MKFKPNEKQQKYGGGILAMIIFSLFGIYTIGIPSEPVGQNNAIGFTLIGIAVFIGYLIKRTT